VGGVCVDDPDTAGEDESTYRCEDGVCQAPCGAGDPCDEGTSCEGGFCRWSNVGGPCADDDGEPDNDSCVSPFGQGVCAVGGVFGDEGMCLVSGCDAVGMEDACTDGKSCELIFGGAYCVDSCDVPADGCADPALCQGDAVGCHDGMACNPLAEGETVGVCLASCSEQADPDGFCEDNYGAPFDTCDDATGNCTQG
jgi:hypothetical protein